MAYSEEQKVRAKEIIIERVSNGDSLKMVIESDERVPKRMTVYSWLNPESDYFDNEFSENYARAREERADTIFDEMIEIADDGRNDYQEKLISEGESVPVFNPENVQRSRVRIDTRKWILSRMNPKKYGDKTDITTGGEKITTNILNLGSGVNPNNETTS